MDHCYVHAKGKLRVNARAPPREMYLVMVIHARKSLFTLSFIWFCSLVPGCGDDGIDDDDGPGTATLTWTTDGTDPGTSGSETTTDATTIGTGDTGESTTGSTEPDFGTPADIMAAQAMWNEIANYRQWPEFPGAHGIIPGESPHGPFVRFYINSLENDNANQLVNGSIVVKENFAAADETTLAAVTVMKRVAGFDPAAGEWFWVKYLPGGALDMTPEGHKLAGKVPGCIRCHTNAGGDDLVFINDPQDFGTVENQVTAAELWQEMADYRQWPYFPGKMGIVPGGAPHGAHVRFFVNTIAEANTQDFADGSIVIKENFTADDENTLAAITVAKKISGFNPGGNDWFWVKYLPGGTLDQTLTMVPMAGKVGGCIGCHASEAGDYIFANDTP